MADLIYKDLRMIIGGHLETSLFIAALLTGAAHDDIEKMWTRDVHQEIKKEQELLLLKLTKIATEKLT